MALGKGKAITSLADVHPVCREALATREALRRLGIPPEAIAFRSDNGLLLVVCQQGDMGYATVVGPANRKTWSVALWERLGVWYNETASEDELLQLWSESRVAKDTGAWLMGLVKCGFVIPPRPVEAPDPDVAEEAADAVTEEGPLGPWRAPSTTYED